MKTTRRRFLQSSLAAAATLTVAGTKSSGRVLGANDTIRLGVAGIHDRGRFHIATFGDMKNVQVACLIDPDSSLFDSRAAAVKKKTGVAPKCVQDIRKALDDKELDAITVATCNHWHSLITIWACQAGKDVYVEKPCSHNIFEGRKCVEAAAKYARIVQHGTQKRGGGEGGRLLKEIASGSRGKLLVSRGACFKPRKSIGFKPPETPPETLDFNVWLGPAPQQPFHRNLVHYNWHWFWDTGCGDIGNQGVHEMDAARWAIPNATLPRSVFSLGGRFGYQDQGQTPNTQIAVFDFDGVTLLFEVRGLVPKEAVGNSLVFDKQASVAPVEIRTAPGVKNPAAPRGPGNSVFHNFIECVRSRRSEDLDAHILEGHYSAALCHLANISYRLGAEAPFDKKSGRLGEDKVASEAFAAMQEHLKDNGVRLEDSKVRLGRFLRFDAQQERFIDAPEADKMLVRDYRPPFVVPAAV